MPKGPRGEKRPADVIGNAVRVMRIATGEVSETLKEKDPAAVALGKKGGAKGGKARAKAMTKKQRVTAAKKAAATRWKTSS